VLAIPASALIGMGRVTPLTEFFYAVRLVLRIGDNMNIKGISKAKILAALYNASRAQGMGLLHYNASLMTETEAQTLLDSGQTYFDYLQGRVMKIDLSGDELRTGLYDRDNGQGAAERAIAPLLAAA